MAFEANNDVKGIKKEGKTSKTKTSTKKTSKKSSKK